MYVFSVCRADFEHTFHLFWEGGSQNLSSGHIPQNSAEFRDEFSEARPRIWKPDFPTKKWIVESLSVAMCGFYFCFLGGIRCCVHDPVTFPCNSDHVNNSVHQYRHLFSHVCCGIRRLSCSAVGSWHKNMPIFCQGTMDVLVSFAWTPWMFLFSINSDQDVLVAQLILNASGSVFLVKRLCALAYLVSRASSRLDVLEFFLSESMFLCFMAVHLLHIQILRAKGQVLMSMFLSPESDCIMVEVLWWYHSLSHNDVVIVLIWQCPEKWCWEQ